MIFKYQNLNDDIEVIINRLKEMSLAHSLQPNSEEDVIVDGKVTYKGIEEMNKYLDILQSEQSSWYYCDC